MTSKRFDVLTRLLYLPLVLLLAAALRLYRLSAKPLWVDEIYTAFYSLGRSLTDIPFGELLSPEQYWALIAAPGTPWQAAQMVTTESNHPPLFFMLMNGWLQSVGTSVWSLRAFAVLWGLVAVAGVFYLGRRVGGDSPEERLRHRTGQIAAVLMAVSPYGIYLSQEARHYSLAMAIATFALLHWVALLQGDRTLFRWLSWIGLNALGLYVHYFYSFGVIAQWLVTIAILLRSPGGPASKRFRERSRLLRQQVAQAFGWLMAIASTMVLLLPLMPTAIAHFQSEGGTSWLSHDIPLYQTVIYPLVHTLAAAVFMLVMLPVEQVPLWVAIPCALVMLCVFGVVLSPVYPGLATRISFKGRLLELLEGFFFASGGSASELRSDCVRNHDADYLWTGQRSHQSASLFLYAVSGGECGAGYGTSAAALGVEYCDRCWHSQPSSN